MKVVILAGGAGTRISEETGLRPKPMIEVGGRPILWHIMKHYAQHGFNDFVICLGYKGNLIKEYFSDYHRLSSDITIDLKLNKVIHHRVSAEPWTVTLVDTGPATMTGGRLKRVREHLAGDEPFLLTYGDGVSDVDLGALLKFHRAHGKLATLTAVPPVERFGVLNLGPEDSVTSFREKPKESEVYINGGFFVLEPKVLDYIDGDASIWERDPMERLSSEGQLKAFRHPGFWQCMDTVRDKALLEDLWAQGEAPWKTWA